MVMEPRRRTKVREGRAARSSLRVCVPRLNEEDRWRQNKERDRRADDLRLIDPSQLQQK